MAPRARNHHVLVGLCTDRIMLCCRVGLGNDDDKVLRTGKPDLANSSTSSDAVRRRYKVRRFPLDKDRPWGQSSCCQLLVLHSRCCSHVQWTRRPHHVLVLQPDAAVLLVPAEADCV